MLFGEGAEHNTGGPSGVSERRWRFISSDTLSRSRRRVAFSNAAEREHASQPSLSQQIHKLEEELNQQLFDRLPRQRKPTERSSESCLDFSRIVLCAEQSNMIEMKILRRIKIIYG